MADVPRGNPPLDPWERAVLFAIQEALRLRLEAAERRRTMVVVQGGKRGGRAA